MMIFKQFNRASWQLIALHFSLWTLGGWLIIPSVATHSDMHELYALGNNPAWGTFKHPPFLFWVVALWFKIFPKQDWAFHLLSVINSSLAIVFAGLIAKELFIEYKNKQHTIFLVMSFCALSLAFGNLALKLNMNTVLLSLWPLSAWCFIKSINHPKKLQYAIALGFVSAACMLSKYFSGVLLLTFLLLSIYFTKSRQWYKSFAPYVALLIFIACLIPHIVWLFDNHFATLTYVESRSHAESFKLKHFISSILMLFVVAIIGMISFYLAGRPWHKNKQLTQQAKRFILALFILPPLIAIVLAAIINTKISSLWSLPIAFALPMVILAFFKPADNPLKQQRFIFKTLYIYWALIAVITSTVVFLESKQGEEYYYLPKQELSRIIEQKNQPIDWVSGRWDYSTALSFYQQKPIIVIPDMPATSVVSDIYTPKEWKNQIGVVIFYHQPYNMKNMEDWAQKNGVSLCHENIKTAKKGWRFLQHKEFNFDIFWVHSPTRPLDCHKAS